MAAELMAEGGVRITLRSYKTHGEPFYPKTVLAKQPSKGPEAKVDRCPGAAVAAAGLAVKNARAPVIAMPRRAVVRLPHAKNPTWSSADFAPQNPLAFRRQGDEPCSVC
jgi:hypothetical protein